jgi:N-acetylneuraminic acid mutarotase
MPTVRWNLGAATGTNGLIYAIGGYYNYDSPPQLSANEAYDPATNQWTEEAPMPTARLSLGVVAVPDGRIFAIGGESGIPPWPVFDTVEVYQPSTNTWSTEASLPESRSGFGATLGSDGNIYLFGGYTTGRVPDNLAYAYNPITNTWSSLPNLPASVAYSQAVTGPSGKMYVIGGYDGTSVVSMVEEYNPFAQLWTTVSSLPTSEYVGAAALGSDGRIYVLGGANDTGTLGTVQAYDPTTDTWTTPTSLPTPRQSLTAAVTGGGIFAFGGALSPSGGGSVANEKLTITAQCAP